MLLDLLEGHAEPDETELAVRRHKLNTLDAVTLHEEAVAVA